MGNLQTQQAQGGTMERRNFLKAATWGIAAVAAGKSVWAADKYYPVKVDAKLFDNINRVKDPANETHLEKLHAPLIKAPEKVKAGEPFTVEVSVGQVLHPMGPAHWIEYIGLNIGNEPAGRVDFQSSGYLSPKATFTVVLAKEAAPEGMATLTAHERCNLHGYWESTKNIAVG
jgi:superoxide reductase